ncbi:tannase/feruloyl esterase family alpha/beta hydrolase [Microbacterium sp. SYP-A9085]|uniref:tannase/feruloyl esterase family alpha/beta hydrolase n=1 Tax=Microbacterium sp. SYP-A9085 TaxID=2664454 RepID=UPI00129B1E14|nr:tannase/feruloyl esterase family alpha/beta hydrolase [Microbacterium sp. SYP-A9085]MRH28897.1 tannase/feruloyl esterase family alpha/beta hydrolase [Microbacterium sp. SYP-A9085]
MRRTAVIAALSAVLLTGGVISGWASAAAPAAARGIAAHADAGHPGNGAKTSITERVCDGLADASVPAKEIGLPTTGATVTKTTWVVDGRVGQCQVVGDILPVDPQAPPIEFQVNLPANWNHRALQLGGGGYDGSLVTGLGTYPLQPAGQKTPLQQGFVTLGSDGGHKGSGGFDSTFGLNDEALANYGTESIKKTHDVAMVLMKRTFRATPKYFYFIGFSQGGHEAINAAGLYPKDYDGVVAGTPSYNVAMMHAGIGSVYRDALYADGGAGWLNPAKTQLLVKAVYRACDGLDGLSDGVISNVRACQQTFDVTTLRCAAGADTGDTCLSDAQIRAVTEIASPHNIGFPIEGNAVAAGAPILYGGTYTVFTLGTVSQPANPASGKEAFQYSVLNALATNIVTRDPNYDTRTFNLNEWADRIQKVGEQLDSTSVDLSTFARRGGKMILTTGLADDGISPENTIQFYQRQAAAFGGRLGSFLKFYTMPGFSHGFGPYSVTYDALPALMNWVEKHKAPTHLHTIDANAANNGRTRPLCEYPSWPKFTGHNPDKASSFTCVTP